MGLADGDLFVSENLLSYQQANRIYTNFRGATVPSALQAGALWSDSGDDKLYHKGASLFEVHTGATTMYKWAKGGDKASASALDISDLDGNYFDVTGVTAITSISASGRTGTVICLHFDGILVFTHHATDLILPSGANISTAAGDEAILIEYDTGKWRCINYSRADGTPIVGGGTGGVTAGANLTDLAIIRGDGGAKGIKTSTALITDAGEMYNPSQPAFLAYNTVADMEATGDNVYYTLDFDTEVFDQGGDFAADIFTAPIDGRYPLAATVLLAQLDLGTYESALIQIVTSNRTYICRISGLIYDNSGYLTLKIFVIADMDANDTAYIRVRVTGGAKTVYIVGSTTLYTWFSGALIC